MNRVTDLADPQRCQGKAPDGQCRNKREVGSDYCYICGHGFSMAKVEDLRMYNLTEARSRHRLAELIEHNPVAALKDVIALARRLLEKRHNIIRSDDDFLIAYRDLNMLQLTVERVVKSANLIEQNLDVLLGKPNALRFGQQVIHIVADELQGIDDYMGVVQRIADQTIHLIAAANNHRDPAALKLPSLFGQSDAKTFLLDDIDDQVRLAELSKHERIKSLNEDIALQIVIIERRWNLVKTEADLMSACGALVLGLKTLEKQIKSAHDIEQTLGNLLTLETAQRIGQAISQIIADELELSDVPNFAERTDQIMDRIANSQLEQSPRRLA